MAKEFFQYPETAPLFDLLEEVTRRSGVSRAIAFEDFLTMSVCALSDGRMEDLYLQTVAKHTAGKPGKRGCDTLAQMFAQLVVAMEQDTRELMKDVLGDLFQGSISYGENGLYLTPMPICELITQLTIGVSTSTDQPEVASEDAAPGHSEPIPDAAAPDPISDLLPRRVHDPCCGSGRMLLAAAQNRRHWEFIGQDVDLRCVRITTLNLAFRNLYGYVIHGNTLAVEQKLIYRTGFDGRGFVREIPLTACPSAVQAEVRETATPPIEPDEIESTPEERPRPQGQLRLF